MLTHTFAICAYKESPYLEACIRSLKRQSVKTGIILCTSTPGAFLEELAGLGIGGDQVEEISVEENQSESVSLTLMMKILEEIPDDSIIYADISFGTKPMSAILLYAMSFVEKMKNCEVDGIYYGEIQRRDGKVADTGFYDLTMFKLLGNVIDQMKNLGISDMQAALNKLIRP